LRRPLRDILSPQRNNFQQTGRRFGRSIQVQDLQTFRDSLQTTVADKNQIVTGHVPDMEIG